MRATIIPWLAFFAFVIVVTMLLVGPAYDRLMAGITPTCSPQGVCVAPNDQTP